MDITHHYNTIITNNSHPSSKIREEQPMLVPTLVTAQQVAAQHDEKYLVEQEGEQEPDITAETVYEYYSNELVPALIASFPLLCNRLAADVGHNIKSLSNRVAHFLIPGWFEDHQTKWAIAPNLAQLWEQTLQQENAPQSSIAEFMLGHFDTNGDGHISPSELLNMTEIISRFQPPPTRTFWEWFSREWPLMDWKLGVFIWRSFGGLLVVIAIMSIMPGRLHSFTAKVLRWPVLGLTYFLIAVELMVYVIIRIFIRVTELLVATPRHRALRRKMARAQTFEEWYEYAAQLDASQKRDQWQRTINDKTGYRYNWAFIQELMKDMQLARSKNDSLLALAVLQQCTRKNVGGVMSEELFSCTNTGEPKDIVKDFITQVTTTLRWVTDEAMKTDLYESRAEQTKAKQVYSRSLERKVKKERNKMWKSLVSWATLSFEGDGDCTKANDNINRPSTSEPSMPTLIEDVPVTNVNNDENNTPDDERKSRGDSMFLSSGSSQGSEALPRKLPLFHKEQLIHFLKRARAAYGRTALCLSGGAMMGLYHFGHVVGLMETNCLPQIISGTSAGSVVGSLVCTRTEEELRRDMTPEVLGDKVLCFSRPWLDRIKSFCKNGHLFEFEDWMKMIKWFTCGDMTFEEAYKKTGRIFCITLSSPTKKAPPVLLNYISAPNVTIASAVVASAAVPGFIPPVRLQYKDSDGNVKIQGGAKDETYFDGSIQQDIPINGLAEMLNTQFFIVAQCNPHVVPFFFANKGGVGRPSRWSSGSMEDSWRGGFLLSALEMYLKNDMKAKFVFLNDLEAAVGFTSTMMTQDFEGSTTIVPQVKFTDYFKLFSNPDAKELERYFQAGSVAAYQHTAMIKLHYSIADALDECLERLETGVVRKTKLRRDSTAEAAKIADALADLGHKEYRKAVLPKVISAALNDSTHHNDVNGNTSDSTSVSCDEDSCASSPE